MSDRTYLPRAFGILVGDLFIEGSLYQDRASGRMDVEGRVRRPKVATPVPSAQSAAPESAPVVVDASAPVSETPPSATPPTQAFDYIDYTSIGDLVGKLSWSPDQGKAFTDKVTGIINRH